jgi:succinate-semialdehyde dehydrogenase/glutarate-semialdehyde dehydrogenase
MLSTQVSTTFAIDLDDPGLLRPKALIDGAWCDGDAGRFFDVVDPATGDVIASLPDMDAADARRAVDAAYAAWPAWRDRTAKDRGVILRRWYDLIHAHKEDLARIMTAEQGKPLAEARGEVLFGAAFVDWYAEEAKRVYGDVIPTYSQDRRIVVLKQPIGVVAAITPWNFPSAMVTRKCAPALAAGCTLVLKPAEDTPLSCTALAVLGERAGFPPGVINVVTASAANAPKVGGELTANPLVRKLSFTGSTEVGKILMRQCADTIKKISLELGGSAPLIVFDDADIDLAVQGAMNSKFRASGQTCTCANRVFVQDAVYETFMAKLCAAVASLKVGRGTEPDVTIGPLINEQAVQKVLQHVEDARSQGSTVALGGSRHALGGSYFEPTVLGDVTRKMLVSQEETFGPVLPLQRFRDEAQVIELANDTRFGLAAYFFTNNLARAWRVAEALEFGSVAINEGSFSSEVVPVGGFKESGVGREGSYYGIEDYYEIKQVCFGLR